jgi:hypothetical protein
VPGGRCAPRISGTRFGFTELEEIGHELRVQLGLGEASKALRDECQVELEPVALAGGLHSIKVAERLMMALDAKCRANDLSQLHGRGAMGRPISSGMMPKSTWSLWGLTSRL